MLTFHAGGSNCLSSNPARTAEILTLYIYTYILIRILLILALSVPKEYHKVLDEAYSLRSGSKPARRTYA